MWPCPTSSEHNVTGWSFFFTSVHVLVCHCHGDCEVGGATFVVRGNPYWNDIALVTNTASFAQAYKVGRATLAAQDNPLHCRKDISLVTSTASLPQANIGSLKDAWDVIDSGTYVGLLKSWVVYVSAWSKQGARMEIEIPVCWDTCTYMHMVPHLRV